MLQTEEGYGRRLPVDFCGEVCRQLSPMMTDSVRMALEGTSGHVGTYPRWLRQAADVRLVDITGQRNGDTTLHLEAPRLGDAAEEIYSQNVLWDTKPAATETAVNVLARVMSDVSGGNADSAFYDPRLLKQVSHSDRLFRTRLVAMYLPAASTEKKPSLRIDKDLAVRAAELSNRTPAPRVVRVVGQLDMVRHSTRSFEMLVDDGRPVRGVLEDINQMDVLKSLLGKRILVVGKAVYRPSGGLLRLDAQGIDSGEGQSPLFSKVPEPSERQRVSVRFRTTEQGHRGVPGFFGKWPGDETEEELLAALRDVSG